ncbi:MAG: 2-hydroxyacid dehydrogenase, partial [Mesorhizobium sp.]
MTKAEQQQAVAILVPGQFNDHAVGRIDRTFSRAWIERPDASLVTDEMRR